MGEVARALVVPDLVGPRWNTLRNLSLFWNEILCPRYERGPLLGEDDALVKEGVVREIKRELPPEAIFPVAEELEGNGDEWAFEVLENEDGSPRVELVPAHASEGLNKDLTEYTDGELEKLATITFLRHLGFIDDSLDVAARNNLAPISHSLGGHLATVVGASQPEHADIPAREAALLSVVVEGFALDSSVSSEDVLLFRSRASRAQARLRASLVDLAAQLQSDGRPEALLAEARDLYRNRVEPALGGLEDLLKENRLSFVMKSVVGATAVSLAPVDPVSATVGGARVMGQTIDYAYSKKRLLREHPYGYLHQVRHEFDSGSLLPGGDVEMTMMSPRESLSSLWRQFWFEGREEDMSAERES